MSKRQILDNLNAAYRIHAVKNNLVKRRIRVPRDLGMTLIKGKEVQLSLPHNVVIQNMQVDAAAFEG
ncbi:MAG TPA: hypothetical protein EYN51_10260, partial [Flavobacteriales bacterium]|nr:hypothetical protein [Flavobacteriales bacterium]